MPGLQMILNFEEKVFSFNSKNISKISTLTDRYFYKELFNSKTVLLGSNLYDGYPYKFIETAEYFIYFEGCLFGQNEDSIQKSINLLKTKLFEKDTIHLNEIKRWHNDNDGDFIFIFYSKIKEKIILINDCFGKLPLYFLNDGNNFIVSREIEFITKFKRDLALNKTAIAHALLFGHTLNKETYFNDIYVLNSGMILELDSRKILFRNYYSHNFDFENNDNFRNNVDSIVSLFKTSCQRRVDSLKPNKNILALSGGLDSRSIAAGIGISKNSEFSTLSFLDAEKNACLDVKYAKDIAKQLKINWNLYNLEMPTCQDAVDLLKWKSGANYLGMSWVISFLKNLRDKYDGRINYFCGTAGDKLLPYILPNDNIKDIDHFYDYLIRSRNEFSTSVISKLLMIDETNLNSETCEYFLNYPEKDFNKKYKRFLFYERALRWANDGDDMERTLFWNMTPFLSINFFEQAMGCPDRYKKYYKLYRNFLYNLSPEMVEIPNASWNQKINSKSLLLKFHIKGFLHHLPHNFKKIIKKGYLRPVPWQNSNNIQNLIAMQFKNQEKLRDIFDEIYLEKILKSMSYNQIFNVFTITSLIDKYFSKDPVLNKLSETPLL